MAKNQQTPTSVAMESGAFKGLKTPRELLQYNLMRGVTDFSNLEQWDLYEKGYPFLCVVSIPQFLRDLAEQDDNVYFISKSQDISADLDSLTIMIFKFFIVCT